MNWQRVLALQIKSLEEHSNLSSWTLSEGRRGSISNHALISPSNLRFSCCARIDAYASSHLIFIQMKGSPLSSWRKNPFELWHLQEEKCCVGGEQAWRTNTNTRIYAHTHCYCCYNCLSHMVKVQKFLNNFRGGMDCLKRKFGKKSRRWHVEERTLNISKILLQCHFLREKEGTLLAAASAEFRSSIPQNQLLIFRLPDLLSRFLHRVGRWNLFHHAPPDRVPQTPHRAQELGCAFSGGKEHHQKDVGNAGQKDLSFEQLSKTPQSWKLELQFAGAGFSHPVSEFALEYQESASVQSAKATEKAIVKTANSDASLFVCDATN